MPFKFNKELWDIGRQIEDKTLPLINEYFECNFERNENDIFDVFDFKDEEKKIVVEVKGRRNTSTEYEDTIITASKITAGYQAIETGYKVYFVFVETVLEDDHLILHRAVINIVASAHNMLNHLQNFVNLRYHLTSFDI